MKKVIMALFALGFGFIAQGILHNGQNSHGNGLEELWSPEEVLTPRVAVNNSPATELPHNAISIEPELKQTLISSCNYEANFPLIHEPEACVHIDSPIPSLN